MSAFQYITPLAADVTFGAWFNQYNGPLLSKVNSIFISKPAAGDGVTLGYNSTSGGYTFEFSGSVAKNMVFSGDVIFNGNVSLASAQLSGVAFGITGNYISAGVTAGKVVKVLNNGGITLAKADAPDNAEALGIAVSVDSTRTIVAIAGKISGSTLANNLISGGFSAGCVYFLDPTVAGGVTRIEPTTLNQVSKPMILGLSNTEAAILPYRGQFINGISGSSGEVSFNSTLYATVKSKGEAEGSFNLRPGYMIASASTCPSGAVCYDGLGTNVYYKAINTTPTEQILGLVGSYIGSYSATTGTDVSLKIYPTSSVINGIDSFNYWGSLGDGVVYLSAQGFPTNDSANQLAIGNISNNDLVLNIQAVSPGAFSSLSTTTSSQSAQNILINGQHHLWQRGRGITSAYGITTGSVETKKQYIADRFIAWVGPNTTGFTAQRQDFSNTQISVLGYPKYYVTIRKTTSSPSKSYYYSVIDDIRTIADKQLTFSVYARTPGGTGTFRIHGIQNVSLSPSGNTYINGTTYSTITTPNSYWNRYTATFVGPTAYSGITNSYNLLGVEIVNDGKTYDFAQFILNEGDTPITPKLTDESEEYLRVAPYYQRTYTPEQNNGSSLGGINNGINQSLLPPSNKIFHTFKYPMKKTPAISVYSIGGKLGEISIAFGGAYFDISNPIVLTLPTYAGCVRSSIPSLTTYTSAIAATQNDFYFTPSQNYCPFDEIAFHYVADADTTIN